jgi:tellurite resistance protein TerC
MPVRAVKTIVTTVVGFTVIAVGTALLVLPGPGLVVIALGLLILSAEFVWAKRLLDRMKDEAQKVRDRFGSTPP